MADETTDPTTLQAWKAAGYTALFSFVGLFALSAAGWLQDVIEWASTSGAQPLPGLSVLGYAAVSAVASASIGFLNFLWRFAQAKGVKLPGSAPSYNG